MDGQAPAAGEPRWIEHAITQTRAELSLYLRTFFGVSLHPARFAREWASGEREAAGPLAFMASSAAVGGVAEQLFHRVVGLASDGSLLKEIGNALAPYAFYSAVGLLCHGLLRLFGPTRRWSSSLAIALYAGGAMPMVSYLFSLATVAAFAHFGRAQVTGHSAGVDSSAVVLFGLVPLFWFFVSLARALAGTHGAKGWRATAAVLVPALLITVGPRAIPVPVMHAHLSISTGADGLEMGMDITNH